MVIAVSRHPVSCGTSVLLSLLRIYRNMPS